MTRTHFRLLAIQHDLFRLSRTVNNLQLSDRTVPDWMLLKIASLKAEMREIQNESGAA